MFTPENRPFTAHRLIMYTLLLNTVLHLLFQIQSSSTWSFLILPTPPVLQDYIFSCFYLYPSLEILDRVISKGYSHTHTSFYYFMNVCLFFIIGTICDTLVQRMISRRRQSSSRWRSTSARMGTYAAALGYQMSFQTSMQKKIIFRLWQVDMEFDASSILLGHTVMGLFSFIGGFHDDNDSFGDWLVWIFGGLVGKELGDVHTNQYKGFWWSWF